MLPIVLALLPLAASRDFKPIEFGRPVPIGTLISLPTPAASSERPINESKQLQNAPHVQLQDIEVDQIQLIMDADFAEIDDSLEDSVEFEQYVPIGTTQDTTLVRRANGIEKRAAFRGTMQIDCLEAPEVCQNACWYQNCLMDAQGDATKIKYQDGGRNTARDNANRLQSGVTTSRGRPCTTWPFGQKFWDTYQFNPNPSKNPRSIWRLMSGQWRPSKILPSMEQQILLSIHSDALQASPTRVVPERGPISAEDMARMPKVASGRIIGWGRTRILCDTTSSMLSSTSTRSIHQMSIIRMLESKLLQSSRLSPGRS